MTISLTKSDILSQANELYGRLTQEQTRIAQLSPQEQISAISLLPLEASLFTDLQQKVENIARGQMQTAYGFSDEEWNALSETLIKSAEALGVIEDNGVIATSYEDINSQITGLQSQTNPNRNEVTSLQERIQNIFEQYAYSINFKNREVLEASLLKLRTLAQKAAAP